RRFRLWVTRHFGSEEPRRPPRERDYLGVPRLPRAADLAEPQVEADSFRPPPLGIPIEEARRLDSLRLDSMLRNNVRDTLQTPPDTLTPDSVARLILPGSGTD